MTGKVQDPSDAGDEADTAPIVFREGARAEFGSASVGPGQSAEIVLAPEDAMVSPVLFLSANPRDASVEVSSVLCGERPLVPGRATVESLRFGHPTDSVVSRACPVVVTFVNNDLRVARVGASLVCGDEPSRNNEPRK